MILLLTPLLLAGLVFYFTKTPTYTYSSETTLFTGIASGSSVEMDKSLSFFATNTAFDNLINVIKSRETQQEVAIRLLAQHLMLPAYDTRYISKRSYEQLMRTTPDYVKSLVVKSVVNPKIKAVTKPQSAPTHATASPASETKQTSSYQTHTVKLNETLYSISRRYGLSVNEVKELNGLQGDNLEEGQKLRVSKVSANNLKTSGAPVSSNPQEEIDSIPAFSFSDLNSSSQNGITLPASINKEAFEQTVKNLEAYMGRSDTNYVYKLLYFGHPHYSIKAISSVNVQRIASSDLVKLKFESNEPGICQQTLALLTEVCIQNYKLIKENRSDAVVKYFEYQLKQAAGRLKVGEDKLLKFNEDNNI
ncbi:MAG: LysM peptidoglycan-binding domain-containing protein, partial [Bacteroidetes bacterium]|nr:LysM peptidoglycan-binding domain-containing protein [Bacteroidota bacterium]